MEFKTNLKRMAKTGVFSKVDSFRVSPGALNGVSSSLVAPTPNKQTTPKAGLSFGQALVLFGRKLNILITAGGTKEDIDPVRYITNFSTGSLGRAFAIEAEKRGHQVTLLAPEELPKLVGPLPDGVKLKPFRSTADLEARLKEAAQSEKWDVVIHSAAVSDYTPGNKADKKISSDQDELVIHLVKTPKLIKSFREWFGQAFLVGFKLLKGIEPKERYRIALAQIKKNRTNLCVENDLTEVSAKSHKARMITPEGGAVNVPVGDKAAVASNVLDFIEKREDVRWFQTLQDPSLPQKPTSCLPRRLLKLAQTSGLLKDENGNLSIRLKNGQFAITPRGKNKAEIDRNDLMVVRANQKTRKVYVNHPNQKPSIDSSVADALYKKFPQLNGTLHTHSKWGLKPTTTSFPYPCGVKEESREIIKTLQAANHQGDQPFLVNLTHHGLILGLAGSLTVKKLENQWTAAQADFKAHLGEIGLTEAEIPNGKLEAMISADGIVGWVYTHADGGVSPRLLPEHQGKGLGKDILNVIREEGLVLKTVPNCQVLEFYQNAGMKIQKVEGQMHFLAF
jgi:hypothetical protein